MHDDKVQFLDVICKLKNVKDQLSNVVAECSKLRVRNGGRSLRHSAPDSADLFSEYWLNSVDLQQTLAIWSQLGVSRREN